jgi:hypothetical protein
MRIVLLAHVCPNLRLAWKKDWPCASTINLHKPDKWIIMGQWAFFRPFLPHYSFHLFLSFLVGAIWFIACRAGES